VVQSQSFGGSDNQGGPSQATGVFDDVRLTGAVPTARWALTPVGGGGPAGSAGAAQSPGGFQETGGTFTLTGSGDIAPAVPGDFDFPTATIEQTLAGAFIGLIAMVVVATMFFTAEYRRGLIRTTFAATPRRGPVLAAKAVVVGAVAFVAGLVASVVAIMVGVPIMSNKGLVVLPVSVLTEARVVVGTAAMLAVAAIFAVALGAVLRRSAAAITIAIVTIVLPFLLVALNVFPPAVGAWLLRLTPAAGLAIEQSIPHYAQVATAVEPARGIYPLAPFAGFAVLCAWAAAAVVLALVMLRRRDV
jgi:ABC-type transport system involved in multi-copper enzyme maturation permease subunit